MSNQTEHYLKELVQLQREQNQILSNILLPHHNAKVKWEDMDNIKEEKKVIDLYNIKIYNESSPYSELGTLQKEVINYLGKRRENTTPAFSLHTVQALIDKIIELSHK